MKKDAEAIAQTLSEPDSEFGFHHRMATRVIDMYDHDYTIQAGPLPDKEYFEYFLKISFDTRYWIDARPWDAGRTYKFPDGHVEIWCGPEYDNPGVYRVYEYPDMSKTHDWMLD